MFRIFIKKKKKKKKSGTRIMDFRLTGCILCVFCFNLSQTTALVLLFWHTHITQGRIKRLVWTFGLLDAFYAFSALACHKQLHWFYFFWHTHVTQGRLKRLVWTFSLLDVFYAFSSVTCQKLPHCFYFFDIRM